MIDRLSGAALLAACLLAALSPSARAEEPERLFLLGVGAYAAANPYESAREKTGTGLLPLFFYQDRRFTADLSGLAVKAYATDRFTLEGRVAPRFQLVDPKETRDYALLRRDVGIDVGGRAGAAFGPATVSLEYLADVSGETKGHEVNLDLTLAAAPTERLTIEAMAGLSWKDEKLATWLYGLKTGEVGAARAYEFGRTAGAPSGGVVVPSLGVQARYRVGERAYVIAAAEVELFDDDITQSPLVAKKSAAAGFVGLVRRF
ncbi:MipA/OmpV family protein [Caulobacter endophyticus]|uniref:MipA/OmpV family protein n=1 Tax=Caulobacter endophyticus TaxID=2172652 RepID=UPI00240FF46F|nr:MipA/OmpV family protein [Caulobacter endophyticus]MDG2531688.1 MipA/OmpV family protein [Caulobacter endophyticus]